MAQGEKFAFGLRFELDYGYLKTADLVWLFSALRSELVRFLVVEEVAARRDIRGKRLAFEITQAESGGSISIDIFPLLQAGRPWSISVSIPIAYLLRELHRWWRAHAPGEHEPVPPFGKGRRNIRTVRTTVVRKQFGPGGELSSETVVEREEEEIIWK